MTVSARILLFSVTVVAAGIVALGLSAEQANACDTGYWNIGCQFYSPSEGHSAYSFVFSSSETVYSTFSVYNDILVMTLTAGGTWQGSDTTTYGVPYTFFVASDKVGCYNHHPGTMYVNCRHYE